MSVAIEELARVGLRCSAEKCKILCDDPTAVAAYAWTPLSDDSADFKRNRRQSLAELKQRFGLEKDAAEYDVDAKYVRRYGGGYDKLAAAVRLRTHLHSALHFTGVSRLLFEVTRESNFFTANKQNKTKRKQENKTCARCRGGPNAFSLPAGACSY
jgi:hypothetical protein